jgi:hypothetical protein
MRRQSSAAAITAATAFATQQREQPATQQSVRADFRETRAASLLLDDAERK